MPSATACGCGLRLSRLCPTPLSTRTGDVHRFEVHLERTFGRFQVVFTPAVEHRTDRLDYVRGSVDAHPVRCKWAFAPTLFLKWSTWELNYAFTQSDPDLVSLLDVTDDANPLCVSRGNADLKHTTHHNAASATATGSITVSATS